MTNLKFQLVVQGNYRVIQKTVFGCFGGVGFQMGVASLELLLVYVLVFQSDIILEQL